MGTDINLCVELKGMKDGVWRPFMVPDPHYGEAEYYSKTHSPSLMYTTRNSNLFAILAGIGNIKFNPPECNTGEKEYTNKFNIISEPRGLPEDVSPEIRREYERLIRGVEQYEAHFHASWLTVREILDFDWDQIGQEEYYFNEIAYQHWLKGEPYQGLRMPGQGKIKEIKRCQMDRILSGEIPREAGVEYRIEVGMDMTYRKLVAPFLEFCEYLDFQFRYAHIANEKHGSNIRLVFWFDF